MLIQSGKNKLSHNAHILKYVRVMKVQRHVILLNINIKKSISVFFFVKISSYVSYLAKKEKVSKAKVFRFKVRINPKIKKESITCAWRHTTAFKQQSEHLNFPLQLDPPPFSPNPSSFPLDPKTWKTHLDDRLDTFYKCFTPNKTPNPRNQNKNALFSF